MSSRTRPGAPGCAHPLNLYRYADSDSGPWRATYEALGFGVRVEAPGTFANALLAASAPDLLAELTASRDAIEAAVEDLRYAAACFLDGKDHTALAEVLTAHAAAYSRLLPPPLPAAPAGDRATCLNSDGIGD